MIKALVDLRAENKVIREELKETYSLMHKAAALQIETASSHEKVLGTPQGRKGATTLPVTEMEKAREAATIDAKKVWNTLAKAMKLPGTEGAKAGHVLSMFESAGQRIGALAIADREYISSLISKGE